MYVEAMWLILSVYVYVWRYQLPISNLFRNIMESRYKDKCIKQPAEQRAILGEETPLCECQGL